MPGQLFVVATPIGNLEDISLRALTILKQADLIACEDTRHTRKLLVHFGIETATTSYHEFNEEQKSGQLLNKIIDGLEIALVSDAGTPLLSDPGYRLVKACRESGVKVTPIPGPFAGASAASVSGLPTDKLLFLGFLPKKKGAAVKVLQDFSSLDATIVIYLAPHGIVEMLKTINEVLGDRPAFLAREMTKLFESNYSGTLNEIIRYLKRGVSIRMEISDPETEQARGPLAATYVAVENPPALNGFVLPELATEGNDNFFVEMAQINADKT